MTTCTEIRIRNILFPTDFSHESVHAVEFVRRLQRHFMATVHVVHVLDLFPFSLASDATAKAKVEEISSEGRRRLQSFIETHGFREKSFQSALLTGEVSIAVDEFSQKHGVDLIVLGSRGDAGLSRLFAGSMSEEVFRTALCPVLVIGPAAHLVQNTETFNHLFFPTDLSTCSRAAVPYIEFLLAENPLARVSLGHFMERDPGAPYARHNLRHQAEQKLVEMITPALRRQIKEVAVEFCSPAEGMIEMAHGLAADLMVLGVRHGGSFVRAETHGLFSITHQIVSQSPCAILTVRGV